MISLPMPGQAKTLSVTTENAIRPPNSNPITVTTGIMMFVTINLVVDVLYSVLDPRVRLQDMRA